MHAFLYSLLVLGGIIAAMAVVAMIGLGLLVWLGGLGERPPREAWRSADEL